MTAAAHVLVPAHEMINLEGVDPDKGRGFSILCYSQRYTDARGIAEETPAQMLQITAGAHKCLIPHTCGDRANRETTVLAQRTGTPLTQ